MENNTVKGIWETGLPIRWRTGKSVRPSDALFRKHGLPTFQQLLQLSVDVGARTIRQPTLGQPQAEGQPFGNLVPSRLADTTPSSAFSLAPSGQVVGASGVGMVSSTAAAAGGGSVPVPGHSGHSSTSSGGMALLAATTMSPSPGKHGLPSATTCHDLPPGPEFAMSSPSIEFIIGGDPLMDE